MRYDNKTRTFFTAATRSSMVMGVSITRSVHSTVLVHAMDEMSLARSFLLRRQGLPRKASTSSLGRPDQYENAENNLQDESVT